MININENKKGADKNMKKRIFAAIVTLSLLLSNIPAFAEIDRVEINQSIGSYIDKATGEIREITSFVAEKNTVIFVELDEETEIDPSAQKVEIIRNGKTVATLSPVGSGKTKLLEFLPDSVADAGGWLAGNYKIKATVGDWAMTKTAEFKNTAPLNILVVPVKANYRGTVKGCTGLYKTARTFLEQTYPVAEKNINWVIGRELDLSDNKYDLRTDEGCYNVWEAAKNLQAKGKDGKDEYDLILAFVPDRQGAEENLQGFTYGKPANIITESDEDMQATVSHEIAHCYKVGDEYSGGSFNPDVNDPPLGMEGRDFNTGEGSVVGKNPVFTGNEEIGEGSLINPLARPYEFGGRGLIENQTISYMGSGGLQASYWTTPTIYEYLYDKFVVEDENKSDDKEIKLVEVYGIINEDGSIETDPLYTFDGYKSDIENVGDYTFSAIDANGKALSKNSFEASFYNPSMNETLDYAAFELYAEFPEKTAAFVISKDGAELYKIPVSANAPTGKFMVNPNKFTGEQTFSWSANDKDGDEIVAQILYSPDGDELYTLEYDYDDTEITIDFEGLEGDENAYLWIVLSDGVNSYNLFSDEQPEETETKQPETEKPVIQKPANINLASSWAADEICLAYNAGLTFDGILSSYQKNITREEFCRLVVTLFDAVGGEKIENYNSKPFADTSSSYVAYAYALGIVNGVSKTEFSPKSDITREQIAAMLKRMFDLVAEGEITNSLKNYSDYKQISSWAIESLTYLNQLGIIKGVSNTEIAPLDNTTREQAILMSVRMYNIIPKEDEAASEEETLSNEETVQQEGIPYEVIVDEAPYRNSVNGTILGNFKKGDVVYYLETIQKDWGKISYNGNIYYVWISKFAPVE